MRRAQGHKCLTKHGFPPVRTDRAARANQTPRKLGATVNGRQKLPG